MVTIVPNGKLRASAMVIVFGSGDWGLIGAANVVMSKVTIVSICNMLVSPYSVVGSEDTMPRVHYCQSVELRRMPEPFRVAQ